jgi:hypothetical protein
MTVPEENMPKTTTTDDIIDQRDEQDAGKESAHGAKSRDMREALDEAGVRPEDVQEE